MTRDELLRLHDQAKTEAATLNADLHAVFEASQQSNADDEHDPEGATIGYERAQLTALLDAKRRLISELDEALQRLDAGTYGVCERCGNAIPGERLEARPAARTCVGCA
ncbi:TraR/DksA C4-type zinc finger protein [Actinoplanes sp. TFC3]|uniref:TraR/DksA family transcriptional regulator n=1 Tax=Actinoplanes sp. TFC3 TaxID=1710355 RepID=UPI0008324344|nr:TraR/DksA C4-type zinc finger protein [Actinoplanes sp. TFC3]